MSHIGTLQRRGTNYTNYKSLIKLNKLEPSFGGQGGWTGLDWIVLVFAALTLQLQTHNIIIHKITVTNIDIFFPENYKAKF